MPNACTSCGFPLDPGTPCPRCAKQAVAALAISAAEARTGRSGPSAAGGTAITVPPGPAWAHPDEAPVTPPRTPVVERGPSDTLIERRPNRAAFDRVVSQKIPAASSAPASESLLARRAAAFAVDLAAVSAIVSIFLAAGAVAYGLDELRAAGAGSALAGARALLAGAPPAGTACALLLAAVASGYFIWFLAATGRTPGMALLDLRVVGADGRAPGMLGALSRWGAFLLALAPAGLGVAWAAFSEVQRGLHDHLSRTSVVRS